MPGKHVKRPKQLKCKNATTKEKLTGGKILSSPGKKTVHSFDVFIPYMSISMVLSPFKEFFEPNGKSSKVGFHGLPEDEN